VDADNLTSQPPAGPIASGYTLSSRRGTLYYIRSYSQMVAICKGVCNAKNAGRSLSLIFLQAQPVQWDSGTDTNGQRHGRTGPRLSKAFGHNGLLVERSESRAARESVASLAVRTPTRRGNNLGSQKRIILTARCTWTPSTNVSHTAYASQPQHSTGGDVSISHVPVRSTPSSNL